jgi:hypothetical protein
METTVTATTMSSANFTQVVAVGDFIGVEPFPTMQIETQGGAFKTAKQKQFLTGLKILAGNDKFPTGAIAFVRGEQYAAPWAKDLQDVDGAKMLICPVNNVIFVKKPVFVIYATPPATNT